MPLLIVNRYTRNDAMLNPEARYIFGDNIKRDGYGGQAAALRGEPNAIGIATLRGPGDPFRPDDITKYGKQVIDDYTPAFNALREGRILIWPADSIGTGFANLEIASPKMWALVQKMNNHLFAFANTLSKPPCFLLDAQTNKSLDAILVKVKKLRDAAN